MRWSVALSLGAALLGAAPGCHNANRNSDRVESELRARESDVRELRDEVGRLEFHNQVMQRELFALRGEPGPGGIVEKPHDPYPIQTLVLGRQTGGHPSGSLPGDDGLQVQVEPRDPEGQALKAPGVLTVEAEEITSDGLKRPLSTWEVPPEELRRYWRSGLLTTGYVLLLPWKSWPTANKLRVTARFRLASGRVLEADRDVTVRPLPPEKRQALPPPGKEVPPASPPRSPTAPQLPMPQPVKPPPSAVPPQGWRPPPAAQKPAPLPKKEAAPPKKADLPPPQIDPLPQPTPLPPPTGQDGPALGRQRSGTAVIPASRTAPPAQILRPVPYGEIEEGP